MIREFTVRFDNNIKGVEEEIEELIRKYGAEERPKGEWVKGRCSGCGNPVPKNEWGSNYYSPYCPECGARMEGER